MTVAAAPVADPPFWSDDFDMDLPKVIPEARAILGDLAGVTLHTTGNRTHGRLNHPHCWNGDEAMLAFFGFRNPARPALYVTGGPHRLVQCTAWEAFRDAWPHSYLMVVERVPIWNTFALRPQFDDILFAVRRWGLVDERKDRRARGLVRASIEAAARRLRALCARHGTLPAAAGSAAPEQD